MTFISFPLYLVQASIMDGLGLLDQQEICCHRLFNIFAEMSWRFIARVDIRQCVAIDNGETNS